jgi:transposase
LSRLEQALRRGARANGYPTELWTLPRITEVIESLLGVSYHPGHVWRLMGQLGWSPQRPVRRAAERDDDAVATWIAERWPQLKKTPDGEERSSSSRTSPASR